MRRPGLVPILLCGLQACSPAGEQAPAAADEADRCASLEDPVRRTVCRDPDLAAMDADLSRLYQRVLARSGHNEKTALRAAYAGWQRELAACGGLGDNALRDCVDRLFSDRIMDLQRRLQDLGGG